ncbi:SAP domain protein [Vibrio phage 1.076.O._10N.286.51.B7]|nr:SAP domain protein [Vibrio phage 1.076.O._10N.286.51.B7]
MKLLTPQDLMAKNADDRTEISGSDLNTVFQQSLAHWKYGEKKQTKPMEFGLVSHAIILDHERFNAEYCKDLDVEEYPEALVTSNDLKAWLKSRGQKVSGVKAELIQRIEETAQLTLETVFIWDRMLADHEEANKDKKMVSVDVYHTVQQMRSAIFSDELINNMLNGGIADHGIVGKLPICKAVNICRPHIITSGGNIVRYCTSTDVHPEKFGDKCYWYGYLLTASLEWDMFTELYGQPPKSYVFLAQEKESPFVWKPYYITEEQLNIGRAQREYAQSLIENAIETNKYSAYGHEPAPLEISNHIMKKYED